MRNNTNVLNYKIMRQLLLLFLTVITVFCKAQIYPLNTSPSDIPDNAYLKDTNNELDKYVGLWKGTWNGKTLFLELKKIKSYSSVPGDTHPYYRDEIRGERKIINSNGVVEIDRISNFGNDGAEFWGMGINLKNGLQKTLTFSPKNMCRKAATLIITNFTPTQMTLHFEYLPSFYDDTCQHNAYVEQNNDFPMNFPKDIVLTKQ
ncbi:hypothetical protein CQ046_20985 [Chryseobacterium sp. MYb7]|nr:hypothetical protein CQ046_20985 [Chryseobacterium sp. MYb7]